LPSTATRSGLQKVTVGEQVNVWGLSINTDLDLADDMITGWADIALTASIILTSTNFVANQARLAMLHFSGTGAFTVTVPGLSKAYTIWNGCTGVLTMFNGTSTVTIQPGEIMPIVTDGGPVFKRVQAIDFGGQQITGVGDPTSPQQAATMAYVTAQIMGAFSGSFPGQGGANGWALFSNGVTPFWKQIASTDLSDFNTRILGTQVALAVAL
jgi:hypothetical protein